MRNCYVPNKQFPREKALNISQDNLFAIKL